MYTIYDRCVRAMTVAAVTAGTTRPDLTARVNRTALVARVSEKLGAEPETVSGVLGAFLDEITGIVSDGGSLVIHGFGKFYRQDRKGHAVHFGKDHIDDYPVLKFSASRSVNKEIGSRLVDETEA